MVDNLFVFYAIDNDTSGRTFANEWDCGQK